LAPAKNVELIRLTLLLLKNEHPSAETGSLTKNVRNKKQVSSHNIHKK
jgi:hypothetical protein